MSRLCVFCGSKNGKGDRYLELARRLGSLLAKQKICLVYGGAQVGVMGAIADACLANNGEVIGVIPKSLMEWEVGHQGLSELVVVESMHERKARMYDLADGFVAIPGGMGTLDELCEIMTWAQLEYHRKPIYVLNDYGFYDNLLNHFDLAVKEGFLTQEHRDLIKVIEGTEALIEAFETEI